MNIINKMNNIEIENKINEVKQKFGSSLFNNIKYISDLKLTTTTISCKIIGLNEDGKTFYKQISKNHDNMIDIAISAHGTDKRDDYVHKTKEKKTNRGRKPKDKKLHKNTGTHMNSCTSIYISPKQLNKQYIIKCFHKESVQIPGILYYDCSDASIILNILLETLKIDLNKPFLKLSEIKRIQVNYKFQVNISRPDYSINLYRLHKIIENIYNQQNELWNSPNPINNDNFLESKQLLLQSPQIKEVIFTGNETHVMVRMYSPRKSKISRTTRIEIYRMGNVVFQGCHSQKYAEAFHKFIKNICKKYRLYFIMKSYD